MKISLSGWVGIILGLFGAIIGIYAAINPMAVGNFFMQIGPTNIATWMPIGMVVFFVAVFGLGFAPFIRSAMNNSQKKKRLAETGIKAKATILNIQDTGLTVNDNPYIKVTVEIRPGMQATFQTMVSRIQIPRVGDVIEVVYDPADPTCVMPAMN